MTERGRLSERIEGLSASRQVLHALKEARAKLEAVERARTEPIAVIGLACRFPGGVSSAEEFWQLLREGRHGIREIPSDRWDVASYAVSASDGVDKDTISYGGFLEHVDEFDPHFFGISPREAMDMDPQQRILLETAWEALEDAGQAAERLSGSSTGVYVGITNHDYLLLHSGSANRVSAYFGLGNSFHAVAGRLSHILGLRGPSLAIDTACSSSLVTIHLACQSLRSGESDMALAGGVNLLLEPMTMITLSKAGILSPDGRCRAFDAEANGTVRGEGCGVVVLKRLSDAEQAGDRILALIRGSAVNHDGQSSGFTVPNPAAQQALIRRALANANVKPSQVGFVEAHGTGTSLGDPIEVGALGSVFGKKRAPGFPLLIGSVKANLGHLEAAAGVAGFVKAVLCLRHQEIPPQINFNLPSPHIRWQDLPFAVPTEPVPWPSRDEKRIAGVSSFSLTGTNAHVVLEEAPQQERERTGPERPLHLLTLSARTRPALSAMVQQVVDHLNTHPDLDWGDTCFTASSGRSHFKHRLCLVAGTSAEAQGKLASWVASPESARLREGRVQGTDLPQIAFLFTGQGSQYVGMGQSLYETLPVFRNALDVCDEILRPTLKQPLLRVLYPEPGQESPLDQTEYAQPALFALEYALSRLWISWGIKPAVVMGHSVGEYAAAFLAGVFSLEDGLRLVAARGRLMQALPSEGEMVAVMAPQAYVAEAARPYERDLSIAAVNGPSSVVISGRQEAVAQVVARVEADGIVTRRLNVSHAFHSPLMDPMMAEFEQVARSVTYSAPSVRIISNISGRVAGDEIGTASYWVRHVREPVAFSSSIGELHGCDAFLELGPNPVLIGMARECLPDAERLFLPSLRARRMDWEQMLESLAALYVRGAQIDWAGFDRGYARSMVGLPTYPFQRRRYWFDTAASAEPETVTTEPSAPSPHPSRASRVRYPRPPLGNAYMAPRSATEEAVAEVWQNLLGVETIGIHDNFFELGGDSIVATQIVTQLRGNFGSDLPIGEFLKASTVSRVAALLDAELAARLTAARHEAGRPFEFASGLRRTQSKLMELSPDQERLWFLDRMHPGNAAYHIPGAMRILGNIELEILHQSFAALLHRHEVLRTTIGVAEGRPVQIIHPPSRPALDVTDLRSYGEEERQTRAQILADEESRAPFDLAQGPLVRLRLLRLGIEEHILLLTAHHIVVDGWSADILLGELLECYQALAGGRPVPWPERPIQYADYVHWRLERLPDILDQQLPYWTKQLTASPPMLSLPSDRPHPELPSYRGRHLYFSIPASVHGSLRALAHRTRSSQFITMLAAFKALLFLCSSQTDLLVGCPVANRNLPETADMVGFLANTLVMRTDLSGDPSFLELVERVQSVVHEAYDHQDTPFSKVVEAIQPERSLSYNPLFQVMFNFLPAPELRDAGRWSVDWIEQQPGATDYDLFLTVWEGRAILRGMLGYSTDLFDAETAGLFVKALSSLLQQVVDDPESRLSALLLPEALEEKAKRARARDRRRTIVVTSTFTAEPVEESVSFWLKRLGFHYQIRFAPYQQVFQQLLDPSQMLLRNQDGVNVVLVRFGDWLRYDATTPATQAREKLEQNLSDLVEAIQSAARQSAVPILVLVCPSDLPGGELAQLDDSLSGDLAAALESPASVHVVTAQTTLERYPVTKLFDEQADREGHIPFTAEYLTALGTSIARSVYSLWSVPYKVLALDCDQTLWQGVCGEDGPDGIEIDPARRGFQEFLVAQHERGMLLTLCSKNNESDVLEVFEHRTDMPLRLHHLAAWRVNWEPKSRNLNELANELGLGLDSFVLLDDNPVECAEVRANCPEVVTLQFPQDTAQIGALILHGWAFDQLRVTDVDRRRTVMVRQDALRKRAREESLSFASFLAGLELCVDITPMVPAELGRIEQLIQRTNQFNATTVRRSSSEVQHLVDRGEAECLSVSVRDRFGDQGLVGVVLFKATGDMLTTDSFLLSCRALGKGVEHRMIAWLGMLAQERGLDKVGVRYVPSGRNDLVKNFLGSIAFSSEETLGDGSLFVMPAELAAALTYVPAEQKDAPSGAAAGAGRPRSSSIRAEAEVLAQIPESLWRVDDILEAVRAEQDAVKAARKSPYVAPRNEIERTIAGIWQDVLHLEQVGRNDSFFDLGGHSLLLVQVSSAIHRQMQRQVSLVELFQYPTVDALAQHLAGGRSGRSYETSRRRGERQRAALLQLRQGAQD